MLDTILPMLYINRAATSRNSNSRAMNQPQAHLVKRRRPKASIEKPVIPHHQTIKQPDPAPCDPDDPQTVCQRYLRSKNIDPPKLVPGKKIDASV